MSEIEKALLDGIKTTLIKQGKPLTIDLYSEMMFKTLNKIIFLDSYDNITRSNNSRENIRRFSKDSYALFIINQMGNVSKDSSGNYSITKSELVRGIGDYVNKVLPRIIDESYFVRDIVIKDDINNKVSNVQYNKPSDECREAIVSGKQISVKYSEAHIFGMQAVSSVGKVRHNQEDSYYIGVHPENNKFKIMLVCDGMGGCNAGEKASNMAARELLEWFKNLPVHEFYNDDDDLVANVNNKIIDIDKRIKDLGVGAGTTLCFSIIKNDHILMASVGDSMGYVFRDGDLVYSTKPDNYIFVDSDIKKLGNKKFENISLDRFHPMSNKITAALGILDSELYGMDILKCSNIPMMDNNDYQVVLCSDGVSDCLSTDEIIDIVNDSEPSMVASNLVDGALNNRSSFKEELEKCRVKAGIVGRGTFKKIKNILDRYGMNEEFDRVINGGKDNTTAISSGIIGRGR